MGGWVGGVGKRVMYDVFGFGWRLEEGPWAVGPGMRSHGDYVDVKREVGAWMVVLGVCLGLYTTRIDGEAERTLRW